MTKRRRLLPGLDTTPWRAVPFLCLGVGCGLFGGGTGELLAVQAMKKHPELQKQNEIAERDERNVAIGNAAKAKGYDVMTFAFGAMLLFSVLMEADLALTLVMVAVYLFIQFYSLALQAGKGDVRMEPKEFLAFLARLEKLKCNTRHSWTSSGRHESVAEHSWRLAMLAMLLRDALPEVDMDKVLRMCLIHDVGEAVTGDIPSFQKTDANEETERQAIAELLSPLPDGLRGELTALFAEMDALATPEARVYKALDKLEVVVQHNEAPLDTWLPLEYELNQTYGIPEAAPFPPLAALREQARLDTLAKLAEKPGGC